MTRYKNRSSSVDSVLQEQPCSWFKNVFRGSKTNRHHKRNKSEKSVHSQTEINFLLSNNDSGIQCSEHFLKMETTRNTLLEFYINDISENSFTKSDILVIENQKKKLLNPMKIFNQILRDVMSHFPEIETSLKSLVKGLIDEICQGFVKLQATELKSMVSKENQDFQQNLVNFIHEDTSRNDTPKSLSTYDQEIENIMETISICGNNYKSNKILLKNFSQDETINKRFHRRIRKRYVVKKCKMNKEKDVHHIKHEKVENFSMEHNIQVEEPLFIPCSSRGSNLLYLNDSIKSLLPKGDTKELTHNKQCTISISPFNIVPIYGNHNDETFPDIYGSLTEKNIDLLSQKTSNPEVKSMARGDELDISYQNWDKTSFSQNRDRGNAKCLKYSRSFETLSLNLDCEILPGSSEYQDDFERTLSSSVSINTAEESFQKENDQTDNPAEVSVIYCADSSPTPEMIKFRNFVDISNSNNYFKSPVKLNLFCESLYEKFNIKDPENKIYRCDTELSVSTKFSKLPDQTVSMSNILSSRSDTVCEVLTDKCCGDSFTEKLSKSRFSVKFIDNFSKDINRKSHPNSSFLKHTIASKMKIKNHDPILCRKRNKN